MIIKMPLSGLSPIKNSLNLISVLFVGIFIVFNSGDGGISVTSPGLYIAAGMLVLLSIQLILRCGSSFRRASLVDILIALSILIFSGAQAYLNNEDVITVVGRNGFLFTTLFLSRFIHEGNARKIFTLLFYLFIFEVVLRFATGLASFGGLYDLKRSFFFPDTNFVGVVLAPMIAYICVVRSNLTIPGLMLILLTASRTAYIGLLSCIFALRFPRIALVVLILSIVVLFAFRGPIFSFLYSLDGSLATKIDIFNNSIAVLSDPYRIIVGYGKTGILEYAFDESGRQLHVGHTLPGNISQYGLILPMAVTFYSLRFVPRKFKIAIFVYLMATGLSGLFPYAYIGFMVILFKSAFLAIKCNASLSSDCNPPEKPRQL
ncbi:hypothetical protein QGM61_13955 [Pseudohongiella sp. SYSU M77423]|uniref:hypothetical protein n=1 Tax=Pseudohongiella sp. SYSU M77423 TaxID=3042312 RepID=UPI002480584E|nr:hypothetical protein [Pseudohongiella sp. SYSU M77423]MDH7944928.1 hypothetical protein [Pseudohongiella sp. SYSU M77423]